MEFIDIAKEYAELFMRLFDMIKLLQFKESTPGDRQALSKGIPEVMTKLEMKLPIVWNTPVVHIFTYHTVDTLTRCGPYPVHNMLDIERFHTTFKSYARGTRNIMQSISNHHDLAEVASSARLRIEQPWTDDAAKSTAAGHAARPASEMRTSRYVKALGSSRKRKLSPEEFEQVRDLWRGTHPKYDEFMDRFEHLNQRRPPHQRYSDVSEWVTGRRTPQELKWQKMGPEVTVYMFLYVCEPISNVYVRL